MMRRTTNCGFTLIELLTVVVIIGILAGLLFSVLQKVRINARKKKCAAELLELAKAWQAYYGIYGTLPASGAMDGSMVQILQGNNPANNPRQIRFMDFPQDAATDGFKDPWDRPYQVAMNVAMLTNEWHYATRVYFINRKAYDHE